MGTEQSSSHATSYSSSFKIPLDNNDHKSSTEIYLQNCSLAENSPQKLGRQENISKNTKCTQNPSSVYITNPLDQSPSSLSYIYRPSGMVKKQQSIKELKLIKKYTGDSIQRQSEQFVRFQDSLQSIPMQRKISNEGIKIKVSSLMKNNQNKQDKREYSVYKQSLMLSDQMQIRKIIETGSKRPTRNRQNSDKRKQECCELSCWPSQSREAVTKCCQIIFDDNSYEQREQMQSEIVNNYINEMGMGGPRKKISKTTS